MKLLYLWVENQEDIIKNQSFTVSNSYDINFDTELNRLTIIKNKAYLENFYGENILDITAIVGQNGTGKTTITRGIYGICNSVCPVHDSEDRPTDITKHIVVYEKESKQNGESSELIIHYFLSKNLEIENVEDIAVHIVKLKGLAGDDCTQAVQQHDMTTIYFTNAFEISDVMNNKGASEFSIGETHKSLIFSPMLSLNRAVINLKEHYGSNQTNSLKLINVIERYATSMNSDFKTAYATALTYNYIIATEYFSETITKNFPTMKDFKIIITEFGQYIKNNKNFNSAGQFDKAVMFIRSHIYEHIIGNFKNSNWEQMYVNILCEIVLFLNMFNSEDKHVDFDVLEKEHIDINTNEAFEGMLGQIKDDEENSPKKNLITRIRNVKHVDLDIIKEFIKLCDDNMQVLKSSTWYKQVENFLEDYDKIKDIKIEQSINDKFTELNKLIIDQYNNKETVYGRMLNVIPQPMSSGEVAMINIFAAVYSVMEKKTSGSLLLIIDEIDAFLHPKWQQDILTYITSWINKSEFFNNKKVQLIVATHSPIILSDIPKDKIIYLKKSDEDKSDEGKQGERRTFGANISSLFYDSFFMEKGSIGAIARKEIQWAIDNIENTNLDVDNSKRLVYIIDNIGEKFLREKLKSYPIYIESSKESRD